MTQKNAGLPAAGAALILGFALGGSPVLAQTAPIQSQDINQAGVHADLIEAKRSDGVLSIKIRLKNTGTQAASVQFYNFTTLKIAAYYVQAESKKYFVLRDTEKVPLATGENNEHFGAPLAPGATFTWWAKYPAPPANVKKFNFYWPLGAPFDDVPIIDK